MNRTMIEKAEAYRAAAKRRREAGGSTVTVYATSSAMYAARGGNVGPGTWEHCLAEARARWSSANGDALEDYRRAVFPERYEEFDDVPF